MIDQTVFNNKRAIYCTLGRGLNFAETSTTGKLLAEQRVRKVRPGEKADICVMSVRSVAEPADKKCQQAIRRISKQHPGALIVVIDCCAQLKPGEVSHIEGVDLVLGAEQKLEIPQYPKNLEKKERGGTVITSQNKDIRSFSPSCSTNGRTRRFSKVQGRCDYYCFYCIIPSARGRNRNEMIASIVEQAQEVARRGEREIVLTGVNIGDFGKSTGGIFIDLIQALDEVEGTVCHCTSSVELNLITDRTIGFMAHNKRLVPHFHVLLQSGSDAVLQLMRRRCDTTLFCRKVEKIGEVMLYVFVGIDVIVRTCGETDEYFGEARQFIGSLGISQLHVSSYPERPGIQALKIDYVVDPKTKHTCGQQLLDISDQKPHASYEAHIEQETNVLLEHTKEDGKMHGFTENYIRVEIPYDAALVNETCKAVLDGWNGDRTALIVDDQSSIVN